MRKGLYLAAFQGANKPEEKKGLPGFEAHRLDLMTVLVRNSHHVEPCTQTQPKGQYLLTQQIFRCGQILDLPSEGRDGDLDEPVNEAEAGDEDENDPPPPKDEEVVLVEDVVWEEAENVFPVRVARDPTSPH